MSRIRADWLVYAARIPFEAPSRGVRNHLEWHQFAVKREAARTRAAAVELVQVRLIAIELTGDRSRFQGGPIDDDGLIHYTGRVRYTARRGLFV